MKRFVRYPFTLKFNVHCLRDIGAQYPMKLVFADERQGRPSPQRCRGCENISQAPECSMCLAAIEAMFSANPELPLDGGVTPDVNLVKRLYNL